MADITFNCPNCQGSFVIDEKGAGRQVNCPDCKTRIRIPTLRPSNPTQTTPSTKPIICQNTKRNSYRKLILIAAILCVIAAIVLLIKRANDLKIADRKRAVQQQLKQEQLNKTLIAQEQAQRNREAQERFKQICDQQQQEAYSQRASSAQATENPQKVATSLTRTWTGQNGVAVQATLVSVSYDKTSITLKTSYGQLKTGLISNLSDGDQSFIADILRANEISPVVSIQSESEFRQQSEQKRDQEEKESLRQYVSTYYPRFVGGYQTSEEARSVAQQKNARLQGSIDAARESLMSGGSWEGSRVGRYKYTFDKNLMLYVVYQE